MMTDPVADLLTRIRNASRVEKPYTLVPATKYKMAIAQVLVDEGFISGYELGMVTQVAGGKHFEPGGEIATPKVMIRIQMKYGDNGERVIRHIKRSSRPGRRYYQPVTGIRRVLDGLGISIVSTSKGVMSDRMARKHGVGGEILATVW